MRNFALCYAETLAEHLQEVKIFFLNSKHRQIFSNFAVDWCVQLKYFLNFRRYRLNFGPKASNTLGICRRLLNLWLKYIFREDQSGWGLWLDIKFHRCQSQQRTVLPFLLQMFENSEVLWRSLRRFGIICMNLKPSKPIWNLFETITAYISGDLRVNMKKFFYLIDLLTINLAKNEKFITFNEKLW